MKSYELHYQPKKVDVDGAVQTTQFGCMNFHTKWYKGSGVQLTVTLKNRWAAGWTRAWFYCKVPLHICPEGGKSSHALHSHMSTLDFLTEPPVNCSDTDCGDAAFVKAG
jgi:hypothetical protein